VILARIKLEVNLEFFFSVTVRKEPTTLAHMYTPECKFAWWLNMLASEELELYLNLTVQVKNWYTSLQREVHVNIVKLGGRWS